ncbi:MAG: glycosyltransferase family 4 protein [Myxococcales bacterium]|nr:glycosyltransferase family 4 protein [Myxococcales bacterium]MCB9568014.1 glycosyltransferase family 4 protein [Myxococcales bacterium]MCB9700458.1 glycosyltransferase family 4 protein [Myxococcales bacterium]
MLAPSDGVLLVSKPLRPPFVDGSTVLVRTLVEVLPPALHLVYFGDPAHPLRANGQVIEGPAMGHAPSLSAKARVLLGIVHPRHRRRPLHLFFTPNRLTSTVVALLRRLQPRRSMIQSLMSAHGVERWIDLLRPLDVVIVLSDDTRARLVAAGLDGAKIRRIYPGVRSQPAASPAAIAGHRRLLYAGDLDAGVADRLLAIAGLLDHPELAGWTLTIACRPKSDDDARQRQRLAEGLAGRIAGGQVELLGEVADMPGLLASSSLQLFLADHVRRKVDLPLVVLEGLALGVGLVSLDFAPLREIFVRGAEQGLEVGIAVAADADGEALREAVLAGVRGVVAGRWAPAAQALVEREFSREAMAAAHVALYDELRR